MCNNIFFKIWWLRACLNFVQLLLDASFITPKTGNINASFISIKYKNKFYRHKRSTKIFSDKILNRLLAFTTSGLLQNFIIGLQFYKSTSNA